MRNNAINFAKKIMGISGFKQRRLRRALKRSSYTLEGMENPEIGKDVFLVVAKTNPDMLEILCEIFNSLEKSPKMLWGTSEALYIVREKEPEKIRDVIQDIWTNVTELEKIEKSLVDSRKIRKKAAVAVGWVASNTSGDIGIVCELFNELIKLKELGKLGKIAVDVAFLAECSQTSVGRYSKEMLNEIRQSR